MEWRGIGKREIKLVDFGIIWEPERLSLKRPKPSVTKGLEVVVILYLSHLSNGGGARIH